jgi:hypothetical protein
MGVSDEAKNVIPLKFLRKIKNKNFFPLVNSIRGHTVDIYIAFPLKWNKSALTVCIRVGECQMVDGA